MQSDFSRELFDHINDHDEFLVIHSAMHVVGYELGNFPWELLEAMKLLERAGKTLLFPSFTFCFTENGLFDWVNSKSESGELATLVRKIPNSTRTHHPIYSFVVLGDRSNEILDCSIDSCFGPGSVFEFLASKNTRLIMLGSSWSDCTYFHYFEQSHAVPYRFNKTFKGVERFRGKELAISTEMFVRTRKYEVRNDFSKIETDIRKIKQFRSSSRPYSIESIPIGELSRECKKKLKENPYYFVRDEFRVSGEVEQSRRKKKPIKRVLIYGSGNIVSLVDRFVKLWNEHLQDFEIVVDEVPLANTSQLSRVLMAEIVAYDYIFLADDFSEYLQFQLTKNSADKANRKFQEYLDILGKLTELQVDLIGISLSARLSADHGLAEVATAYESQRRENNNSINKAVIEKCRAQSNVSFIDTEELIVINGVKQFDNRLYGVGRFSYSDGFSEILARKWIGLSLCSLGRSIRVLVLDLDNTLWGGIVGEDGVEGVELGGDYPGVLFSRFQTYIKSISERGVVLTVVSKNDPEPVLEMMNHHPGMILKEADFVLKKINWRHKYLNIVEIAEELNIGLSSIGFVDDNPAEREMVKQMLPSVKVFELGNDPASYISDLNMSPYLDTFDITTEDKARTINYQARSAALQTKRQFSNIYSFYRSLDLEIILQNVDNFNIARTEQLFNKTNQFNTTQNRYSKSEITNHPRSEFVVISVLDKFSAKEIVGVLEINSSKEISNTLVVVSFVLSCRVLGKGVEQALLSWVHSEAAARKLDSVLWKFRSSERNNLTKTFLADNGKRSKLGFYSRCMTTNGKFEPWATIHDERD